ncbi:hypothetical protein CGLAMM_09810 [Acetobacteraceae bacterium EV16G]|uniref:Guanylate cyclase domain-containing protein n=1 Tax=Sorlinia euscelidii TaxID=3081148 RepID=A0ABU7U663_9PROT
MRRFEIVNPEDHSIDRRFRRGMALAAPIIGIIAIVAVISAVSVHSYHVTRARVIGLTQTLLHEQQKLLTREVSDYLGPAPQSATIAQDLLTDPLSDAPPRTFLDYGRSLLNHLSQIDSMFIADDRGTFWFINRAPRAVSDGVEWVRLLPGKDVFRHWYYNQQGDLVRTEDKPANGYDARQRDWYLRAVRHPGISWAEPYPSQSRHEIFSTASSALTLRNGHRAVFAINLSLTHLSGFLEKMKIGQNGKAIILDEKGRVVAGSDLLKIAAQAHWQFDKMAIDAKQTPVFSRALSLYRIYGSGVKIISGRKTRYVTIYSSLDAIRPGWLLILHAPESDYARIISVAGWQGFAFSLLIIALAAGLAGLLFREKRRTLRATRQVDDLRDSQRVAEGLIGRLVEDDNIFDIAQQAPILSESVAEITGTSRVALWRVQEADRRLICEDAYEAATGQHGAGREINPDEAQPLLEALERVSRLDNETPDSAHVLRPLWRAEGLTGDVTDYAVYPIRRQNGLCGLTVLTGAVTQPDGTKFLPLINDMIALRYAAIAQDERVTSGDGPPAEADVAPRPVTAAKVVFLDAGESGFQTGCFPAVPVATIQFIHQDVPDVQATVDLFQKLATKLEEVAETYALSVVQLAGNRVLLVGKCGAALDPDSVCDVADALLELREAAQRILNAADMVRNFNMGLDVGPVLGAHVGRDGARYALWGEAFANADRLAMSSAETGSIQVSDAAWAVLKDRFLFRPRGAFFMPGRGLTVTHILAARR